MNPATAELRELDAHRFVAHLGGNWTSGSALPSPTLLSDGLVGTEGGQLRFDTEAVESWDSRFITWVIGLSARLEARGMSVSWQGLPAGVAELIQLSRAVPERVDARRNLEKQGVATRLGNLVYGSVDQTRQLLAFIGEVSVAFYRFLTGRARFRRSDFFLFIQETGVEALPIVGLISLLVGLILAFIGTLQLAMFGAQIYVANLVGIAMVREMGAMMAAIIMAGRTGASFSAQLGTMQVNEEIDAFRTLGISPVEFLVLPRMLALMLMMPLLCVYADLLGIAGGMLVSVTMFDITVIQYLEQTRSAIDLTDITVGILKSVVFGVLVAIAGCMKGIQCGRSASAVGQATTSAVVMSIVAIVVADAIITLINNVLGV